MGCTDNARELKTIEENYQTVIVNGNSMSPMIDSGDELKYISNYYVNNDIQRDDVVLYNFTRNINLIIKRVKGIPGDSFEYGDNNIYINGQILKNSQNISYFINSNMLELYANSYPVLPKDTYLILGDTPRGSKDSSVFGLVNKNEIVGKVIIN